MGKRREKVRGDEGKRENEEEETGGGKGERREERREETREEGMIKENKDAKIWMDGTEEGKNKRKRNDI